MWRSRRCASCDPADAWHAGDADAPATVLLEPFAAAGPGRLSSAALPLLSLIAALACMLA